MIPIGAMVQVSCRPLLLYPFIGHGKVKIFLLALAKTLDFMSGGDWLEEFLISPKMEGYHKWIEHMIYLIGLAVTRAYSVERIWRCEQLNGDWYYSYSYNS